jgi:hypothetical protein
MVGNYSCPIFCTVWEGLVVRVDDARGVSPTSPAVVNVNVSVASLCKTRLGDGGDGVVNELLVDVTREVVPLENKSQKVVFREGRTLFQPI